MSLIFKCFYLILSWVIRLRSIALFMAIFITQNAKAHIVGSSEWCLANSPVHFECYLSDQDRCEHEAKKRTTPLEDWRCVPYPIDFSKIPKSGEKLDSKTTK